MKIRTGYGAGVTLSGRLTSEQTEQGRRAMKNMAFMMGDISGSSAQATESISVIERIAFQPHILALNATRGAARAAELGHGFAVVAGELHNPAQRCSVAAGAIKEFIHEWYGFACEGTTAATVAVNMIEEIIVPISRVSVVMSEISLVSGEHTQAITQDQSASGFFRCNCGNYLSINVGNLLNMPVARSCLDR